MKVLLPLEKLHCTHLLSHAPHSPRIMVPPPISNQSHGPGTYHIAHTLEIANQSNGIGMSHLCVRFSIVGRKFSTLVAYKRRPLR